MRKLTTNILVGGVGGQGLILMTRIICQVAMKANYDVKSNDVVGLSQRGGMVWGNVRFGEKVYSPNIPSGEGDILVSMEPLEALRWSAVLKEDGIIITNTKSFYPTSVQQEKTHYPHDDIKELKNKYKTIELDANQEAIKLGKKQVSNVILLGVLAKQLDIHTQIWEETIRDNVPVKYKDMNIEAFNLGYGY